MTHLSDARIALAALRAGFPVDEIPMAVAISLAESYGDPLAKSTNGKTSSAPGSHDLGLWQINDYYHPDLLKQYDWRDPDQNGVMAFSIFHADHDTWGPWSTYHNDSYAQYLQRGEAAYRSLYRFTLTRLLMFHPDGHLDHGQDVLQLQRAVGIPHGRDGIYGSGTENYVRVFQRRRGLADDGVVGPQVCKALGWTWAG